MSQFDPFASSSPNVPGTAQTSHVPLGAPTATTGSATAIVTSSNQASSQWAVQQQQQSNIQHNEYAVANYGYQAQSQQQLQQLQYQQQQQQYMQHQQSFASQQQYQQQQYAHRQNSSFASQPQQPPPSQQIATTTTAAAQQQQQQQQMVPFQQKQQQQQQQQQQKMVAYNQATPQQQQRPPPPPPSDLDIFLSSGPPTNIVGNPNRPKSPSGDSISTMSTHRTEMNQLFNAQLRTQNASSRQLLSTTRSPAPAPPPAAPAPTASAPTSNSQREDPRSNSYNNRETASYDQGVDGARNKLLEQRSISNVLAQNASPGASPLPNVNMVVRTGFILSRISLRTIFMKVWKQTYWMQYGPTVLLLFRSKEDGDDWLTNPYHTLKERNFLVKLKIDFVRDLHKTSVRGYRAARMSMKNYQKNHYHQFKLERWMDYGPAIACAFASPELEEAQNLRNVVLQCMKNSPVNNNQAGLPPSSQALARSVDDSNVRPSEISVNTIPVRHTQSFSHGSGEYFQYDEGVLAAEKVQMQQAEQGQTVAQGRYNNY